MSLATRCTACGTVFRVVQDQLKVSEGWVRCGRCSEVFNALEGLFDLERDTPPEWPASVSPEIGNETPAGSHEPTRLPGDPPVAVVAAHPLIEAEAPAWSPLAASTLPTSHDDADPWATGSHHGGRHSTPAGRVNERDRLEFPDAQFDPDMLADDTVHLHAPPNDSASTPAARSSELGDTAAAPEFVRHAQRLAQWRSPAMRAGLVSVLLVLIAALALQSLHHHRNVIAARWPATQPLLAGWCHLLACRIEPPNRIDDVAVESTALTRAAAPDAFKLSVVLRNRGAMVVALPSIDLTLTDTNGQLIARRVLAPSDFRAASLAMKPGGESALQLLLTAGNARVTGYTVEVFYP